MIFLYNFRCRTRIAGGLMIRDYVANQSKDNNEKRPMHAHRSLKNYLMCLEPRSVIATPSLQRGHSSGLYVGTSRLSKACTFS